MCLQKLVFSKGNCKLLGKPKLRFRPLILTKTPRFEFVLFLFGPRPGDVQQRRASNILNQRRYVKIDGRNRNLGFPNNLQLPLAGLISKLAQIGTFWPFLTTFGTESVTRLIEIFSRLLISVKTINGSAKCGSTIHTTLLF